MYETILSANQQKMLPFLETFHREYYLVGGTAIALQLGHRESIDFDMFKQGTVHKNKIITKLKAFGWDYHLIYADTDSFHILVEDVKLTFFNYPFHVPTATRFGKIKMPNLLHLAAMKAYALGRRAKWKDYVDLYFIMNQRITLNTISDTASTLFGGMFSAKLFKQQLAYFADVDYSEEVTYCQNPVSDAAIKASLINIATQSI
jgi:Nucleotidyl transferase AbiEii toxin, Type IV TA system